MIPKKVWNFLLILVPFSQLIPREWTEAGISVLVVYQLVTQKGTVIIRSDTMQGPCLYPSLPSPYGLMVTNLSLRRAGKRNDPVNSIQPITHLCASLVLGTGTPWVPSCIGALGSLQLAPCCIEPSCKASKKTKNPFLRICAGTQGAHRRGPLPNQLSEGS